MAERLAKSRQIAWRQLLQAHARLTDNLAAELQKQRDLSLPWYEVLAALDRSGGSLRMQQLANAVFTSKSNATRLVERLVDAGFVERRAAADDGRGTEAAITPTGRQALRRATPVYERFLDAHFGGRLTGQDVTDLRRILDKLDDRER